jgi:hypothetical protein
VDQTALKRKVQAPAGGSNSITKAAGTNSITKAAGTAPDLTPTNSMKPGVV